MNIFKIYRDHIIHALNALEDEGVLPTELDYSAVVAEPPREATHGDIATNAAMVLAKVAKTNPRALAEKLVEKLKALPDVTKVEVAGPGFINLTLQASAWQRVVMEIVASGTSYGNSDMGKGQRVNVEYVSANPTGPMHIGHARGAVVGDVIASLFIKAGYEVTKEYYINDAGSQVDTLARSTHLRYREALGETIGDIPEGLYPGDYLKGAGEALAQAAGNKFLGMGEQKWLPEVRSFAIESMMALVRNDLLELGIEHDVFTSERGLVEAGKVDEVLKLLQSKGLIYQGVLEPPKGKTPEDWEPREQTLFKATEFGDDVDRPLKKSDGSWTYFAGDAAYHMDKYNRGFRHMTLVLGADHGGYMKRMKALVKAISDGTADIHIELYQLVKFMEGGEPLKMSKRKGTFLTVRDVIEAVGKDVVRFIMLTRKSSEVLEFDIKKVLEQSKDNPVFYVQYAHARSWSVLRAATKDAPEAVKHDLPLTAAQLARLNSPEELHLIKTLAQWPRVVEAAASALEPHRVAYFLQEAASAFHQLWNKGKEDAGLRFVIAEDIEITKARLALVRALSITIHTGLSVLGVEPVREM